MGIAQEVVPAPDLSQFSMTCDLVYEKAQMIAVEVCAAVPRGMTATALARLISGMNLPTFRVRHNGKPYETPAHRVLIVISPERATACKLLTRPLDEPSEIPARQPELIKIA